MLNQARDSEVVPLDINASGATNCGLVRAVNEDSLLVDFPVYIVADGMGGHSAGDVASATVIEVFQPLVGRSDLRAAEIAPLVEEAQSRVEALSHSLSRGAGSTLTGVFAVLGDDGQRQWLIVNIGDSRTYRWLGGRMKQVTVDHSEVQELIDRGQLLPENAATYSRRNVITRAVGDGVSRADYALTAMVPGERFLVCSDGLTGEVTDGDIQLELSAAGPTEQVASRLVERALAGGGRDNVTVLIVEITDDHPTTEPSGWPRLIPVSFDLLDSEQDEDEYDEDTIPGSRRSR